MPIEVITMPRNTHRMGASPPDSCPRNGNAVAKEQAVNLRALIGDGHWNRQEGGKRQRHNNRHA
ncbi:MAG: hypothetical protein V3U63_00800, partial [Gemmatimonadota bacterium]